MISETQAALDAYIEDYAVASGSSGRLEHYFGTEAALVNHLVVLLVARLNETHEAMRGLMPGLDDVWVTTPDGLKAFWAAQNLILQKAGLPAGPA
jgi:ligand-binding sensor domain-containing protein